MSLDRLGEILHDALDKATLETIKAHTKDEKWMYEIQAFSKPDGENRHDGIGHNIKNRENAGFLLPD